MCIIAHGSQKFLQCHYWTLQATLDQIWVPKLPRVAMALFSVCHPTTTTSTTSTTTTMLTQLGHYVYKCQGCSCHYDLVCVCVRYSTNRPIA